MRVHHLNISCKNIDRARTTFTNKYDFKERGWLPCDYRSGPSKENKVPSKSYLLVKEEISIVLAQNDQLLVDTIDDIAFSVESAPLYCNKVKKYGGSIIETPCFIDCMQRKFSKHGELNPPCACGTPRCCNFVQRAVIKSPVGNITHTLLDKKNFQGEFLPGFISTASTEEKEKLSTNGITRIDHVALAVGCGETANHVTWYENCLQMGRFKTNITETKSGLLIRGRSGNGLRMLTLAEHPCSDIGVGSESERMEYGDERYGSEKEVEVRNNHVKFVFVESLLDEGSDQVQIFLRHHGGPGVQHVAFHTKDITTDANAWIQQGVSFIHPPLAYYSEIKTTLERLEENSDVIVTSLKSAGILVDCEKHEDEKGDDGYLYQVFTKPVFDSHTFFFELIQRDNAKGFGAGNVKALWRALDSSLNTKVNNA